MAPNTRLVPLIVASPMLLQNIDVSAMMVALPSIAGSLGVPPLSSNAVITVYLLSLAMFLPMSAWLADRFGAKQLFCTAIALFTLASALCGVASSMTSLVLFRAIQGLGASMMVPVGRLIVLRSVPPSGLVAAMVWYTVPATIGRLAGPLVGGIIVSITSWHWIFFVNIPFGVLAIILAVLFVEDTAVEMRTPPFDFPGFLLMAVGLAALLGGLDSYGTKAVPQWTSATAAMIGAAALGLYGLHSRNQTHPIIDLRVLRFPTFRTNILGAVPLRLALFSVPFLLPLMFQLAFDLSPFTSGILTAAAAVGSLFTRGAMHLTIHRFGFRRSLLGGVVMTGLCYASYALLGPATPHALTFSMVFAGGLLSSLCTVSLNALGLLEIPKELTSHATALISMTQQLTAGAGVVLSAVLLTLFSWGHGGERVLERDFSATFVVVGLTALLSVLSFARLSPQEGNRLVLRRNSGAPDD